MIHTTNDFWWQEGGWDKQGGSRHQWCRHSRLTISHLGVFRPVTRLIGSMDLQKRFPNSGSNAPTRRGTAFV